MILPQHILLTEDTEVYIAGGYVRDRLLGRESQDHDYVVVGATPEIMINAGFKQVGLDFPVFLAPNGDQFALARTERKSGAGYHGFAVSFDSSITLEQDLVRRDLTINAMARRVLGFNEHGHAKLSDDVTDLFGGTEDLKKGILRHVSSAFAEDPLRVLRVARFASRYNFTVEDSTLTLMQTLVANGEVAHLTPERVWAEFDRALMELHPTKFFWVLDRCGASQVLFPELHRHVIFVGGALERAALHGASANERFSVLTATLPPEKATSLCERIRAPEMTKSDAKRASLFVSCFAAGGLTSEIVFDLIQRADGFRRPNEIVRTARSLLYLNDHNVTSGMDRVLRALRASAPVSFANLTPEQQQNLKGKEISAAIDNLRLAAIRRILY